MLYSNYWFGIVFLFSFLLSCRGNQVDHGENEIKEELTLLWSYAYDLDGGAPRAVPFIHDSVIISSGDLNVTALNWSTGAEVWKTAIDNPRQVLSRNFVAFDDIFAGTLVSRLVAWNLNTGTEEWTLSFDDGREIDQRSSLYKATDNFHSYYRDYDFIIVNKNGSYSTFETKARVNSSLIFNGILILAQSNSDSAGFVTAYNLDSMEQLWEFRPGGVGNPYDMNLMTDGNSIFIGFTSCCTSSGHAIFAINPVTGREVWQYKGHAPKSAVLADGFLFIDDGLKLLKLSTTSGRPEWMRDYESAYGGLPIFFGYGHIYATHNGEIKILDAETGEIVHRFSPPDGSYFWLVTAAHGRIFAQSNRHLYAYAPWGHTEPIP